MGVNTRALSGFLELLPGEQAQFDYLRAVIEQTFVKHGFTSIETPLIERAEVLLAKGGDETDKQVYYVTNGLLNTEKNELALRYDLTVPLARYVADHYNDLVFPFRRYQIAKVYRGERAGKGRFREFYQCDVDIVGRCVLSLRYDAEVVSVIYALFKALDIGKFTIRLNNRKILSGFLVHIGISANNEAAVLRSVDKAEKITENEFTQTLDALGLTTEQINTLGEFMAISGTTDSVLDRLYRLGVSNETFAAGMDELKTVCALMSKMGVPADYFTIDLSIARGLAYYTGMVYETTLEGADIGSVCSGGRYDNLADSYTWEKLPGVGMSIGLTRLFWYLREKRLLNRLRLKAAEVVVVPADDTDLSDALTVAKRLREAGANVEVFLEEVNQKKKLKFLARRQPRYAVMVKPAQDGQDGGLIPLTLQYKDGGALRKEDMDLTALIARIEEQGKETSLLVREVCHE